MGKTPLQDCRSEIYAEASSTSGLLRKDLLMVETMVTSALQDCQEAALVLHSPSF